MTVLATETVEALALTPTQWIGIPIALVAAVFLSLGAQYQHRGVRKVDAASTTSAGSGGLDLAHLGNLLKSKSWIVGTLLLGTAIVLQLVSLGFSPLIVVQPLGAVALVITAIVNSKVSGVPINKASIVSITMCVFGIAAFVLVAAFHAENSEITDTRLIAVLIILAVVLIVGGACFLFFRQKMTPLAYIIIAGVVYGFVATLAKTVISRVQQDNFDWLTILAIVGLLTATILGLYFVQNAYASGPPDLVIAGLTVIDPLVAILIGIAVLGEAQHAPLWVFIAWIVSGLIAMAGVFGLSKYHPDLQD